VRFRPLSEIASAGRVRRIALRVAASALFVAAGFASSSFAFAESDADTGALPIDDHVVQGVLDNGLRYLVRSNGRPEARAELRLVVAAGSVDEDDDQRGLAHFVEHMMFNGTENFAGNDIIEYLESIGARFGADLNAYTSFDETVYSMEVPTDREGLLDDGIRILSEFAVRATFDEEEIRKERGVVLDEWRGGLGAGSRIRDQQLPILLQGSRYAERLPIGLPDVIERGDRAAMRRFYEDWYRPERMAVVVVGDFDAKKVESRIRAEFSSLKRSGPARERVDWPVPPHADTLFAFATDPELRRTSISLVFKRADPEFPDATVGE
jgi:zinc protease